MRKAWDSLVERSRSPWFLAPLCFGTGAAAATAVLGIPKLWSQEAAGWAAAIGTFAAVVISLHLARGQSRKEKLAQRSRARWVALELRHILASWRKRVAFARWADAAMLYAIVLEEGTRDPRPIPAELLALNSQLHELGDDATPIADAIWIARALQPMPICDALRGDIESQKMANAVEAQFRAGMGSLLEHLKQAERNVSAITGLTAVDPDTLKGLHRI